MADREELIRQVAEALVERGKLLSTETYVALAEEALDAVEPLIRADEQDRIITSLHRNRDLRDWSQYSMGYRDSITDTITQIAQGASDG